MVRWRLLLISTLLDETFAINVERLFSVDISLASVMTTKIIYEPPHDKTNKMTVRPAKTQISLDIHPVWSESSLSAWRKLWSLTTRWTHSEDSDQTGRMPRLIWVFAGRTVILLVLSRGGSYIIIIEIKKKRHRKIKMCLVDGIRTHARTAKGMWGFLDLFLSTEQSVPIPSNVQNTSSQRVQTVVKMCADLLKYNNCSNVFNQSLFINKSVVNLATRVLVTCIISFQYHIFSIFSIAGPQSNGVCYCCRVYQHSANNKWIFNTGLSQSNQRSVYENEYVRKGAICVLVGMPL